jgi:hypothetical protein
VRRWTGETQPISSLDLSLGPRREPRARGLRSTAQVVTWLGTCVPIGAVLPVEVGLAPLVGAVVAGGLLAARVWRRRGFAPPVLTTLFGLALGAVAPQLFLPSSDVLVALATEARGAPCAVEGVVAERARPWGGGVGLVVDVTRARCGGGEARGGRLRLDVPAEVAPSVGEPVAGLARLVPPPLDDALRFRLRARAVRRGIAVEGAWVESSPRASFVDAATGSGPVVDPDLRRRVGLGATRAMGGLGLVVTLALLVTGLARVRPKVMAHAAPTEASAPARATRATRAPSADERARSIAWPSRIGAVIVVGALVVLAGGARDPSLLRLAGPALSLAALLFEPTVLDPRPTFAASVLVTTLIDPASLGDLRYQLAFAGALAIGGPVRALARRRGGLVATLVAGPLLALGTLPLVARQSPHVSLASLALGALTTPLAALAGLARLFSNDAAMSAPFTALDACLDALAAALARLDPAPLPTPSVLACLLLYAAIAPIGSPAPDDASAPLADAARRARRLGGLAALGLVGLAAWPTVLGRAERTAFALPGGAIVVTTRDAPFAPGRATLVSPPLDAPRRARLERTLGALRWARRSRLDRFACVAPRSPSADEACAATARALAAELRVDALVRVESSETLDAETGLVVSPGIAASDEADEAGLRLAVDPARREAALWRWDAGRWSPAGLDDDAPRDPVIRRR